MTTKDLSARLATDIAGAIIRAVFAIRAMPSWERSAMRFRSRVLALGAVRCWSLTRGGVPARFCALLLVAPIDELAAARALRKLKRDERDGRGGTRTMARTHDRDPAARALRDSRKVTASQSSGRSA